MAIATPAGCIFSPKKGGGGPPPPPEYPQLINPFSVLEALEKAYAARDTNEIKLIYDVDYQGTSFDPKTLISIALTKSDEVAHVAKLARTPSVTKSVIDFPSALVRGRDESDPPGWAQVTVQGMTLEVVDGLDTWSLVANETFEYRFIPYPDDTSPTDTLWKIVRWTEF